MGTVSKFDTRQSWNHSALSAIGSAANTTLDVILGDINSIFAAATSAPTPSVIMKRDSNGNTQVNNLIQNGQEIASSGGTTILVVGSPYTNIITGTATQTIQLPAANTLTENQQFLVVNNSTQSITVTNNGGATIQTMVTGSQAIFTVTNIGSTNGTWSSAYSTGAAGGTVTSIAFVDDTGLFNVTGSPITTAGTLTLANLLNQPSGTYFGGSYIDGTSAAPTFKQFLVPTMQQFTASGIYVPTYVVQLSAAQTITAGAVYYQSSPGVSWTIQGSTSSTSSAAMLFMAADGGEQQALTQSGTLFKSSGTGPSSIVYTSWSNSPLYIRIQMVGGGGGGASIVGSGSNGTNTTFSVINTITDAGIGTLTAGLGFGGVGGTSATRNGGAGGGTAGVGTVGVVGLFLNGSPGTSVANSIATGGNGGASFFGGAGLGHSSPGTVVDGTSGASYGAGGGGTSGTSSNTGGAGGGSGGYIDVFLYNPWPSTSFYGYPISIGTGGAGAGGDGNGGNGANGFVQITEYYQ